MKVLLIEDDLLLAKGIEVALGRAGYAVEHVSQAGDALRLMSPVEGCPDLVILDLGLPDMDGMELLQVLKQQTSHSTPVLILTARDSLSDKVNGLDSGADDYLTKPFELEELLARLRVLERRTGQQGSAAITLGDVTLDTASHTITLADEQAMTLPRREFALLRVLMENPGRIYSREQLIEKMYRWDEEVASNAVDVHLHNIRKKVGPGFIRTIRVHLENACASEGKGQQEALQSSMVGHRRLVHLVEQLLLLARTTPDSYMANFQQLNLRQLCQKVIADNIQFILDKRQLVSLVEGDPVHLDGDFSGLDIMLNNLVRNAALYTPVDGQIQLRLAVEKDSEDQRIVVLSVADSGPGIPKEQRARVFDRFYRSGGSAHFRCRRLRPWLVDRGPYCSTAWCRDYSR